MRYGFTIHHNGPPVYERHTEHTRCDAFWRAVRNYHVNTKGWSDIAYSFGVCRHGVRYEGRGWNKSQWANGADQVGPNDGGDAYWYTVLVFLGGDEPPTPEMYAEVTALIQEGRDSGRCGTRILPHNAFKVKACPGTEFTAYANQFDNQPLYLSQEEPEVLNERQNDLLERLAAAVLNDANPDDGMAWNVWHLRNELLRLDRLKRLEDAVANLQLTGGQVDLNALAEAVADKLAARLAN